MKALVADDDRLARELQARTLARWDFDVTAVADGTAAWAYLAAADGPALVLLDWMMPGLDGPEVCRRLRRERPTANIYVVMVTALESRKDVVAGLEAGADDYVIKPFDPDELRARVQVGRRVLTLQDNLAEQVERLEAALANVKRLRGLLPICSYCKRIRGDDRYWQQVESYLSEHTDAEFTHGICPSCFDTITRDLEMGGRSA